MTMLDKTQEFEKFVCLAPIVVSDNTPQVGGTVDLSSRSSVNFDLITGVLADADATFDVQMFEGDAADMSDEVEVTNPDLIIGQVVDFTFSDDGAVKSFGYRGKRRYVRVKVTPTGNAGSAPLCILATLGKKKVGSV